MIIAQDGSVASAGNKIVSHTTEPAKNYSKVPSQTNDPAKRFSDVLSQSADFAAMETMLSSGLQSFLARSLLQAIPKGVVVPHQHRVEKSSKLEPQAPLNEPPRMSKNEAKSPYTQTLQLFEANSRLGRPVISATVGTGPKTSSSPSNWFVQTSSVSATSGLANSHNASSADLLEDIARSRLRNEVLPRLAMTGAEQPVRVQLLPVAGGVKVTVRLLEFSGLNKAELKQVIQRMLVAKGLNAREIVFHEIGKREG